MPLTDNQVKRAQPGEKDYKLADAGGLHLFVTTKGAKSWRWKYRYDGKEKRMTFGLYPDVSLREARDLRDDAKRLLRDHKDPSTEARKRKLAAQVDTAATFEVVARRWHEAQLGRWSPVNATKVRQALERDVFPQIGKLPLVDIDRATIVRLLRRVEKRGAIDTAKRIRQHIGAVFEFAVGEGVYPETRKNPAGQEVVKSLLPTPVGGSMPGLDSIAALRELHAAVDGSTAHPLTKLASRLLGLTFVRPGLVPSAKWHEFEGIDWDAPGGENDAPDPVWRVSAERMKLEIEDKGEEAFEHVAPLTPQAVDVLRAVRKLTGRYPYLFHSFHSTHKPMSSSTIGVAYNRVGYRGRHVPHGWRTSFSTIMNERATVLEREADRPIIDAMLSHKARGISAAEMAYNRARHMPRRWELARWWADQTTEGLRPALDLLIGRPRAA